MDLIESSCRQLTKPAHLRASVRVVIGLLLMGCDEERIVQILLAPPNDLAQFVRSLRASRHPVIAAALEYLPPDCSVPLPNGETIRCRSCGATVASAPCPACATLDFPRRSDTLTDCHRNQGGRP